MRDLPTKQEARIILQLLEQAMEKAGIDSAKTDARCLLGLALGRDMPVLPHELLSPLDTSCRQRLFAMLERRIAGEPVSRIRGWREFWSLRFAISRSTLDPRPDSETIIEAAVTWVIENLARTAPLRCLDLGTGSGCLLLALLSELPKANGVGIDLSPDAIDVAAANANNLSLGHRAHFHQYSFCDNLSRFGSFDIVISNPPYIPTLDISGLKVDVRDFDPVLALDGGIDGMACWQGLLPRLAESLSEKGTAFVEIGMGQESAVVQLAANANLELIRSYRDLSDEVRCLQFVIKM